MQNNPSSPDTSYPLRSQEWTFIAQHMHDDVRTLALQAARYPDIDMPFCLQQIAGRQQAAGKLPSWTAQPHVIFPPKVNIEQCSSEKTARYKAILMLRLWKECSVNTEKTTFIDATGGFGVDFVCMANALQNTDENVHFSFHYADTDEHLCQLARHNFYLMGVPKAHVHLGDGMSLCRQLTSSVHHPSTTTLIYIDPSRRDLRGQRTYAITDCTPDICQYHDEIVLNADICLVKLSPMVDWHEAVRQLPATSEVHIVSTDNECKELLLVLRRKPQASLTVCCVNDEQTFSFEGNEERRTDGERRASACQPSLPYYDFNLSATEVFSFPTSESPLYLYEPNASVMKAGCFSQVADYYHVHPISNDSHLFVSVQKISHFIGRSFVITAFSLMKKKALQQVLQGIVYANVAVRNFPLSSEQLRQKLHLKDGGDHYLFGTTTHKGQHIILCCRKMQ